MEYDFGEEAKNSTSRANCISLTNLSVGPSGPIPLLPDLTKPRTSHSQQMLPGDTGIQLVH